MTSKKTKKKKKIQEFLKAYIENVILKTDWKN